MKNDQTMSKTWSNIVRVKDTNRPSHEGSGMVLQIKPMPAICTAVEGIHSAVWADFFLQVVSVIYGPSGSYGRSILTSHVFLMAAC